MKIQSILFISIITSINAFSQTYQWTKQIGGSYNDFGTSIAVDANGNIYTAGSFSGTVDFDPGVSNQNRTSSGGTDIYITKSDAEGDLIWVKTMGGVNDEGVVSIAIDNFGNVYSTGNFRGVVDFDPGIDAYMLSGYNSVFFSKLDASGNFLWARNIEGVYYTYVFSMSLDASGNVYSTGHFEGGADFDPSSEIFNIYCPGGYNIFILKLDMNGDFVWAKGMGGLNNAQGESITVDKNNRVYVTGHFNYTVDFDPGEGTFDLTSSGKTDVFILKLDIDGNFIWAKQIGGPGQDDITSIIFDDAGSIYTLGSFEGVCDFDPSSEKHELISNGYSDIFMAKLNTSGELIWAKTIGGSDSDFGITIALDSSGNIFATGKFRAVADLDPGPSTHNLTSLGEFDSFILKLDPLGNFLWCEQIGGYNTDEYLKITTDSFGAIYGTGYFSLTVNFDPSGAPSSSISSAGGYDTFILKLESIITGIDLPENDSTIEVFPNPFYDEISIKCRNISPATVFTIFDQLGNLVFYGKLSFPTTSVNVCDSAPGLYFLKTDHPRSIPIKIIKL